MFKHGLNIKMFKPFKHILSPTLIPNISYLYMYNMHIWYMYTMFFFDRRIYVPPSKDINLYLEDQILNQ